MKSLGDKGEEGEGRGSCAVVKGERREIVRGGKSGRRDVSVEGGEM